MTADDERASVVSRIAALPVAPWAYPAPPAGLDLTLTWQVEIGSVVIADDNLILNSINTARTDAGLPVSAADIAAETAETALACPSCGAAENLRLQGRWGHPADPICPACGHQWRPVPDAPMWGILAMKRAIAAVVPEHGVPDLHR